MMRAKWMALILAMLALGSLESSARQFQKAVYYHAGQLPFRVVATQVTRSGYLDLVLADYLSNQIVTLLGNGDGTFQKPVKVRAPSPMSLVVGDFDEDGNIDLAVTEFGGTGHSALGVFLGSGNGKFRLAHTYVLGVGSGAGLAVADFNGDGHLDIVANNPSAGKSTGVQVFPGTGKGTFGKPASYMVSNVPGAIAAGDLNGDHHPDIAINQFGTGSVAVFLNDGTGHFQKPASYNAGGGEVVDVKIADLRNNGKQDLVIANGSLSAVGVLRNRGDGTFAAVKLYPTHCLVDAVVVADFNRDGHLDAAVAAHVGNSALLYGRSNGSFGPPSPVKDTIQNQGGYSIAAGDFNGDNAPDLAIPIQSKGKVAILLNSK